MAYCTRLHGHDKTAAVFLSRDPRGALEQWPHREIQHRNMGCARARWPEATHPPLASSRRRPACLMLCPRSRARATCARRRHLSGNMALTGRARRPDCSDPTRRTGPTAPAGEAASHTKMGRGARLSRAVGGRPHGRWSARRRRLATRENVRGEGGGQESLRPLSSAALHLGAKDKQSRSDELGR